MPKNQSADLFADWGGGGGWHLLVPQKAIFYSAMPQPCRLRLYHQKYKSYKPVVVEPNVKQSLSEIAIDHAVTFMQQGGDGISWLGLEKAV